MIIPNNVNTANKKHQLQIKIAMIIATRGRESVKKQLKLISNIQNLAR